MPIKREDYQPITGSPRRHAKQSAETKKAPSKTKSPTRKRRVYVTPNDWEEMEEMASTLGLPYSKVYNMAFQALREKTGM